ncbi:M56 family metallopeptidase [Mucilaginibacter xinganensis]|uniref:Peptidase M56 domain-containing protein n=1 Tax=Mucilaginibacter xinganensis TaxID=1234841 RepID=A0A223NZY2_9SPHI|nr:M56 family metallopeptidase [Mucilaginibacter xinganensis]ASU35264.1 hypothetical protein MuYL_3379 [Mucilaginibacter xinganensis]
MPALFVFLFKVNIALLLFCAGYYLVLRHLTFYTLNRIYLVAAILFATIYPKINLSGFLENHQQIAKPVQVIVLNWQVPAKALVKPIAKPDYWVWAEVVLWTGIALFALRLMVQLYSLYKLYRSSTAAKIYDHEVRLINSDSGPFSFWKSIYINPAKHDPADLKSILLHEQIHVSEWHTLDVLLAELSTIFYWFNPGVWLMKKAVRENIEFITDRRILNTGTDSKQYQYSLVNVSFSAAPQGIVNHFNISTIKKRIIMMNAKRSSKFNLTRYAFLVPAVVVLLLVFSISKAALIKKSSPVVKSLAAVENKLTIGAIKSTAGNKAKASINLTVKSNWLNMPAAKVTDTIRKGKFFIRVDGKNDSANYIIDGVKATRNDLKALDPGKIESVVVYSGVNLNKFIPGIDDKKGVICITTINSEAGRKFKEKLDGKGGNPPVIAGVGDTGTKPNGLTKVMIVGSSSSGSGNIAGNDDSDNSITVTGSNSGANKVQAFNIVTKNGTTPATLTLRKNSKNDVIVQGYSSGKSWDTSQVRYTFSLDTGTTRHLNAKPYNIKGVVNYNSNLTFANSNSRFSLNHLSDKLVIINGKMASVSDLKKLSAFDIDKMVLKTDDETKELYGEKAKNGIVFIVTRKSR